MMTSKVNLEGSQDSLSTRVRAEVQSMLKSHAAEEGLALKYFLEAGMILVLNKTSADVMKILHDFKGSAIK